MCMLLERVLRGLEGGGEGRAIGLGCAFGGRDQMDKQT